jgi:hypothetical protein
VWVGGEVLKKQKPPGKGGFLCLIFLLDSRRNFEWVLTVASYPGSSLISGQKRQGMTSSTPGVSGGCGGFSRAASVAKQVSGHEFTRAE